MARFNPGMFAGGGRIRRSLNAAQTAWDHLAGTTSAPFEAGQHGQVAVKVIDDRGNELLVVKKLSEAGARGPNFRGIYRCWRETACALQALLDERRRGNSSPA